MTIAEFFGGVFLVFGPPLAMFLMTIAHDPIRIIILVAAAFIWLCSLLLSSLVWLLISQLGTFTIVGVVVSIFIQVPIYQPSWQCQSCYTTRQCRKCYVTNTCQSFHFTQEAFRYIIYRILRETETGLQDVSDNSRITENKHILAYVSGFGFGIMAGAFSIVNILADTVRMGVLSLCTLFYYVTLSGFPNKQQKLQSSSQVGPATIGLLGGNSSFLLTSATQALCIILLHTFWSIILFNACDNSNRMHLFYVVVSHLLVSGLSLLNQYQMYAITLTSSICITIAVGLLAFSIAGGSLNSFKRFITCK